MTKEKHWKNGTMNISNLFVLYKGEADLKLVAKFGFSEMRVELLCAVEKEIGVGAVVVSVIDPDRMTVVTEQFLGFRDYSGRPVNDMLLYYRVMKIFETLPVLLNKADLGIILQSCLAWDDLPKEQKKQACDMAGLSLEFFEKTMRLVPPNFEATLSALRQAGITVSINTIQKEVAAGNMDFTPLLKKLGVKSPDEYKKENDHIEKIISRNLKHVRDFVKNIETNQYDAESLFVQMVRHYMRKAIARGINEDDLVVGFALFEANYRILDQAAEEAAKLFSSDLLGIGSALESEFPGIKVIAMSDPKINEILRETKKQIEIEFRRTVSIFLANRFSETGRKTEQYQEILDKIRKQSDAAAEAV